MNHGAAGWDAPAQPDVNERMRGEANRGLGESNVPGRGGGLAQAPTYVGTLEGPSPQVPRLVTVSLLVIDGSGRQLHRLDTGSPFGHVMSWVRPPVRRVYPGKILPKR